jgi:CRISPR/Cas system-associated exonuclease Cas4 (RecB family)
MAENEKLKSIAVKELGNLAKKDFCPRCFWYEKHFGPFPSVFPGVFNVIDRNLKNSVWSRWKKEKKLPEWLKVEDVERVLTAESIGKVEERSKQKYLVALHKKSGLILRGAPDLILQLKDGTIHIIDFKTAKFKEEDDEFFPVYEVQLNGYALLATKMRVSKLSLVYFNPTNIIPEEFFTEKNFRLDFEPKIISVEIKPGLVSELLMKAKEILFSKEPPPSKEKCQGTCVYLDKIISHLKLSSS